MRRFTVRTHVTEAVPQGSRTIIRLLVCKKSQRSYSDVTRKAHVNLRLRSPDVPFHIRLRFRNEDALLSKSLNPKYKRRSSHRRVWSALFPSRSSCHGSLVVRFKARDAGWLRPGPGAVM